MAFRTPVVDAGRFSALPAAQESLETKEAPSLPAGPLVEISYGAADAYARSSDETPMGLRMAFSVLVRANIAG
jgi:hypothetical protein